MKVINYFESDRQTHWLEKIRRSDWGGGAFLFELLSKGTFSGAVGERSRVLLLTRGDELISFCTYAEKDDIQPTELTPWMGFVFTFPKFRGHRYVGKLFEKVMQLAKEDNYEKIYISTNHTGLYEKYGCEFLKNYIDDSGKPTRVYVKKVND